MAADTIGIAGTMAESCVLLILISMLGCYICVPFRAMFDPCCAQHNYFSSYE